MATTEVAVHPSEENDVHEFYLPKSHQRRGDSQSHCRFRRFRRFRIPLYNRHRKR